ncbi:MAG: class I SAM-dependent methyltransferase [Erythrobacter sp.]|uniref:class I SAM-dependent methyltransferase n=1 Tax=Erythrobacter sp. TaxID=1042 RepID=UPI003A8C36F5
MADNTADTDWIDCHDLRRDQETRWNGELGAGRSLGSIALFGSWRSSLRLIEPDGTETLVPIEPGYDPEAEARAQAAAEEARKAAEEQARREAEERERREAEERTKRDAEERAKAEAEELAREQARIAADKKAREEAEKAAKAAEEEARRKAEAEARAKAKAEAEARAKAEAEEMERIEAELREKTRLELERQAKAAAEAKAKKEAEEKARKEAEAKAKAEAEAKAKREAEEKAKAEAAAKAKKEAEEKAKREAEEKAKREAEEKARSEAEEKAKKEAEAKAKAAEEAKARKEAEEKAKAEAKAKKAAEEKARKEAEAKAKAEAESEKKKKAEAAAAAKAEAEAKAMEEAEAEAAKKAQAVKKAPSAKKAQSAKQDKPSEPKQDAPAKPKDLGQTFRRLIRETGPISLAHFMAESNAHYYTTRDPLGEEGDFITAPEVSQMFGELIGLWFADLWVRMGSRKRIHYVELGPGRGTLTKDALRTAARYEFDPQIHFVETSPELRKLQLEAFPKATHHHDLSTLPDDAPLLIIANEFFDALPVHQLVRSAQGWHERMIGLDGDDLVFVAGDKPMDAIVPPSWKSAPQGTMIETSAAASAVMAEIAQRLKEQGGAALIIDYGPFELRAGSTLQALRAHEKVDPLKHPGEADLTTHVDFELLKHVAEANGADVMGLTMQGDWLRNMGIEIRHEALVRKIPEEQAKLKRQFDRLVDDGQMGALFKVLGICGRRWPIGVGFD